MKTIIYYLLLLVFIGILTGFLISGNYGASMSVQQMLFVAALLILYVIGLSWVGNGNGLMASEPEGLHQHNSNRAALIGVTTVLTIGALYQLFARSPDYWLLAGLISINLVKIVSLVYLNYKK